MCHSWTRSARILSCALFALLSLPAGTAQRYTFKSYGQSQGLKNLNVDCMLEDRDGFVWLGTDNGLFRYDGARFIEFNAAQGLANPYVLALVQDSSGRLWAGTGGGLFYLDANRFHEVQYKGDSLSVGFDSSLSPLNDGRLLVVSRYHPYVVSTQSVEPIADVFPALRALDPALSTASIYSTRSQHIWLGCGKALCEVAQGALKRWTEADGVPLDDWNALFESSDGSLWARGTSRIIALPPGAARFEDRSASDSSRLFNNFYVSFAETANGQVATVASQGLAFWTDGHWRFYGAQQGFSPYPITSLLIDHSNNIWMGVAGHGMARWLGYGRWEHWTTFEGLESPIVWGVLRDRSGRIWIADDSGISVSDSSRTRFHPVTSELKSAARSMQSITEDPAGRIWAVSGQGVLLRITPGPGDHFSVQRYPDVASGHQIYADPQGRIWISTEQGLYSLDQASASSPRPVSASAQKVDLAGSPAGDVYRVVADPHGSLWAAGQSGLFTLAADGLWHSVPSAVPNLVNHITDMDFGADGSLWAVTAFARVWRITLGNGRITAAQPMTTDQISSSAALFVRSDRRGRIWIGHDRGVDVFDGNRWRLLDSQDGLLWNDVNNKAFFADPDGSDWIGTSEGLSHYLGQPVTPQQPLSAPRIESLQFATRLSLHGDTRKIPTRIPWHRTPLEIRISPLLYEHEGSVIYRYRMAGVDPDWIVTDEPSVHYPPLPPGEYTFEVVAVDPVLREVSPSTALHFVIVPRWWQTWIAHVGLVLLALILWALLWRWRVRHLLHRQQELEALVSLRTRELEERATHDGLTGLWNHKRIVELLHEELTRAKREKTPLTVVLIDLDYFKAVNDQMGHLAGDSVLRELGRRFKKAIRSYDAAGRYGGEEFLILLPHIEFPSLEFRLAALKSAVTELPIAVGDAEVTVTCSMGVAFICGDCDMTPDDALSAADKALYRAKENGRNRIEFATTGSSPHPEPHNHSPSPQ